MKRTFALLGGLALLTACRPAPPPLPEYGAIPDFTLTDRGGQPFAGHSLRGKIWVADFMFTNCPGPCPRMSSRLHQVQEDTAKIADVALVSFTIDPANDTPAVLAGYAKEHAASARWHFLTGPQATLHQLCRYAFKLGDVDGSLTHSTKFVLVDRNLQIRGYYDSFDPESMQQLEADIRRLEEARP